MFPSVFVFIIGFPHYLKEFEKFSLYIYTIYSIYLSRNNISCFAGGTTPLGSVNRLRPDRERCTPKMKIFQVNWLSKLGFLVRKVQLYLKSIKVVLMIKNKKTWRNLQNLNILHKLKKKKSYYMNFIHKKKIKNMPLYLN